MSLFILVDNDGKSRLGAQAFLNDETQESYEWVLQQTLDVTGSQPRVILTDMDPAMTATCQLYIRIHITFIVYGTCLKIYPNDLNTSLA